MLLGQTTNSITDLFNNLFGGSLGTAGLLGVVVFGFVAWWLWRWWRN